MMTLPLEGYRSRVSDHVELSDMFFQNHIRVFYDFLAGYIQQRIDEGAFQPVPSMVAARAFMGMLIYHRLVTVLFHAPLPNTADDIAQTFVTIMMNGLKIPSPTLQSCVVRKKRTPPKRTTRNR
jgi:hypothetical protein